MAEDDIKQSREEFQEARRALVDMLAAQYPGTTYQDGDGVKIAELSDHFKSLAEQRANEERETAARHLGISVEDLDALKAKQEEAAESTPQSRTANLPAGTAPTVPAPRPKAPADGHGEQAVKTGVDLMQEAAEEFLVNSGYLKR